MFFRAGADIPGQTLFLLIRQIRTRLLARYPQAQGKNRKYSAGLIHNISFR
jgi:hypothetical protein